MYIHRQRAGKGPPRRTLFCVCSCVLFVRAVCLGRPHRLSSLQGCRKAGTGGPVSPQGRAAEACLVGTYNKNVGAVHVLAAQQVQILIVAPPGRSWWRISRRHHCQARCQHLRGQRVHRHCFQDRRLLHFRRAHWLSEDREPSHHLPRPARNMRSSGTFFCALWSSFAVGSGRDFWRHSRR